MRKALVVSLSLALFCTACSTAWMSTLDSILAAAAPALINILQIVAVANGQPVNSGMEARINGDASAIETLAADFAKASAATAPGICEELQVAISAYQADQQLVLQVAQVNDASTQTKITQLADLVAGTVGTIMALIPPCQSAASSQGVKAGGIYSVSAFEANYNRILLAPTGNLAVDAATKKLKLRQQTKIVRWLTLGRPR